MTERKTQTRGRKRNAQVALAPEAVVSPPPEPVSTTEDEKNGEEKSEEKAECVICFEPPTKRGTINCCDHVFCSECILQWSKVTNKCPVCKRVFSTVTTAPPPAPPQKGKRKRAPPKPKVHKVKNKEQRVEANYGGVGGGGLDFRDIVMMREMLTSTLPRGLTVTRGPMIGGVPFPGGMLGPPPAHGNMLDLLRGWDELDELDPDYEEDEEDDEEDDEAFFNYMNIMSRLARPLAPPPLHPYPGRGGSASASASGGSFIGRGRVGEVEVIDLIDDDEEQGGSLGSSSSSSASSSGGRPGRGRERGGMRLPVSSDIVDLTEDHESDEGATTASSSSPATVF
mmetsp:Transcript_17873/g.29883  ORF Transcript_17873/g.29883 Transcript_17873/m.29883 type:complete len:340 (+) Transcript_17873:58-1077(+)|eukprot:CAMPEP_0114437236 /NCGR_PEP_ID=MMETSP0103-20121206/13898_1 /TAXON_ID=37642 ORGANISM="Paraphysomonas imperforata, Strain PA2" /NCGR_SAMPLE_ID=MMETSP0103 /ASSEMBLY_ACC=CAM_ASM_000201 /LENGTH=339 /DNA_ID=CAMNT_0001607599 /DNA_START=24 /DNA_END=1043 /DNA_ORIENTATION=+